MRLTHSLCSMVAIATTCSFAPYIGYAEPNRHIGFGGTPFEFYGQVNLGFFRYDDGTDKETAFLDNDNSNTRLGLWFRNPFADGSTLKFNLEANLGLEKTDEVTIDDNNFDLDFERTDWRHIEAIYESANYGTFYLGQGSMSADTITEADFSGTDVITYVSIPDLAGAMQFREKDEDPSLTTVGSGFSPLDGSRRLRARYDTPSFNGFVFSASYGQEWLDRDNDNNYTDVGVRYKGDYGDFKLDGRLAYQWIDNKDTPNEQIIAGSAALLHTPTGISGLLAGGSADESDSNYFFTKLGYQQDRFTIGTTHFSVDYYNGDDFSSKGSDSKSWAVAAVQQIERYNLEIYAAYRNYDFDSSGTNFEDVKVYALGARWKF